MLVFNDKRRLQNEISFDGDQMLSAKIGGCFTSLILLINLSVPFLRQIYCHLGRCRTVDYLVGLEKFWEAKCLAVGCIHITFRKVEY